MSAFYDNNVTDVGRLLLGDVQMGASFVPTKIVIGKGYLPQGKTTRTMTDVADVVKELALNKATKNPDGDAIFGAIFSNADIQEAFYYRELGLYAKGVYYNQSGGVERETAEVLYSYGNAGENAELIPAYSTGSVVERQLDLLVYIGNDTEVKLEIETGLYVTIPVFNDTVERLEKDIEEVRYIVDSTTAKKYEWAMESGTLSLDEVGGDTKINIADKETLDAVKEKVDLIHTNTEGLSGKIGETNDSGGSEAAGSVFAKLNKIIGDIAAHVKQWTAERAAKLDQLDTINENAQTASTKATELVEDVAELKAAVAQETTVEGISNKIGAEGDADTQPTLFGRLAQVKNVLVEKLAEVLEKVSGFDAKIGETDDTVGSNKAGSVMGKLNTIYNLLMGGLVVYDEPGTYEWTVPAGITKIRISGAGAGAGAGGAMAMQDSRPVVRGGGGGGAGSSIVEKEFTVTPGEKIQITVGKKGKGGKGSWTASAGQKAEDGTAGTPTIIGELITLSGGFPGLGGVSSTDISGQLSAGGEPGGEGGNKGNNGFIMYYQSGWRTGSGSGNGNGGTTTLGNVGNGGSCKWKEPSSKVDYEGMAIDGTDGLDGYVSISWGV
nr:hypothetical protein [uncultured Anaerotignum sp.]